MLPKIISVFLKNHQDPARYGSAGLTTETIITEAGTIKHDIGPSGRYVERQYSGRPASEDWDWTNHAKKDAWLIKKKLGAK